MKKFALLCAAALFLTACHCERKTTGTPCRKGTCQTQLQSQRNAEAARRAAERRAEARRKRAEEQARHYAEIGRAKRRGNIITVEYEKPIQFGHNSDQIDPVSFTELDRTANLLKRHPENKITIKGYTDSLGDPAYNVDLSQRRAKAVADALIERGVPAANVSYAGYGAANPVATNDTLLGRRQNRRVELDIDVQ